MSAPGRLPVCEIFYSPRGEGHYTGVPATFIRLGTCNLDCTLCDTEFDRFSFIEFAEVTRQIKATGCSWVVFTGGEPLLHAKTIQAFQKWIQEETHHKLQYHLETNGTLPLDYAWWNWVTCSPKVGAFQANRKGRIEPQDLCMDTVCAANELKLILGGDMVHPEEIIDFIQGEERVEPNLLYVQPWMDDNYDKNLRDAIALCLRVPEYYRLSLQTHKWIGVR